MKVNCYWAGDCAVVEDWYCWTTLFGKNLLAVTCATLRHHCGFLGDHQSIFIFTFCQNSKYVVITFVKTRNNWVFGLNFLCTLYISVNWSKWLIDWFVYDCDLRNSEQYVTPTYKSGVWLVLDCFVGTWCW